jgi:hypothetical protein
MADTTKPALTVDQVRSAAMFGPELCRPVAQLMHGFEAKLPPDQVLMIGSQLGGSLAYFGSDSGLAEYYERALREFKDRVKAAGVRPEFFARQYDPAIAFFRAQIARRRAVKLNCMSNDLDAMLPDMVPLPRRSIDERAITTYFKNRFGIAAKGPRDVWPAHRAFMSDIRKGKDLVIVLADTHSDHNVALAHLKLVDRLLPHRDRVDLRSAEEDTQEHFTSSIKAFIRSDVHLASKRRRAAGASAAEMFLGLFRDPAHAKRICAQLEGRKEGLPPEACMTNVFIPSIRASVLLSITDDGPTRFWPTDDPRLYKTVSSLIRRISATGDDTPAEEVLSLYAERRKVQIQRSVAMAHNLARRMQKEGASGKPRIVVFTVGAIHAFDVIRTLQAKGNLSVIGLLPDNFTADCFRDIIKAPK